MTPSKLAFAAALLSAPLSAAPVTAFAHHGWSGQDNEHVTTLEGTISGVRYRNPHGEIDLVSGGQKWLVTLAPVARMSARGVTEEQLKVGDKVKIDGHRNLDQARYEVKANDITIGGKTTDLR